MPFSQALQGWSRKLWPNEGPLLVSHLMRLSPEDRGRRFMAFAGEAQVRAHVERRFPDREAVIGWFSAGTLRAVAEISIEQGRAEVALTVEAPWRRQGVAAGLLARTVRQAQIAGAHRLILHTATSNVPLIALARRAGARVVSSGSDATATLDIGPASASTMLEELAEEQHGQIAALTAMLCPLAVSGWSPMLDPPRPDPSGGVEHGA